MNLTSVVITWKPQSHVYPLLHPTECCHLMSPPHLWSCSHCFSILWSTWEIFILPSKSTSSQKTSLINPLPLPHPTDRPAKWSSLPFLGIPARASWTGPLQQLHSECGCAFTRLSAPPPRTMRGTLGGAGFLSSGTSKSLSG